MMEIILSVGLVISIVTILILSTKKTPNDKLVDINDKLKSEIEDLKTKLSKSEQRRKNLLSINSGDRALITYPLTSQQGTKNEFSFNAFYEVEVIDVTDKKIKVSPYNVITDNNKINSNATDLQGVLDFIKNKWVEIELAEPILDTQVRREDKLEELI